MVEDVLAQPVAGADQALAGRRTRATTAPPPLGRWWALAAAVGAGVVMTAAFPPVDLWWSAAPAVGLLALACHRRGPLAGAGLGLLAGLAFFLPLLSWTGLHVGWVWLFLPAGEAAYFALLGAATAVASPVIDRWRWTWPLVTGALWVAQEAARDRTPFGGFPWGRLAFSQGDSPLLRLAGVAGAPLVTFGVAVTGGLLALALASVRWRWPAAAGRPTQARSAAGGRAPAWVAVPASLALAALFPVATLAVPTAPAGGATVRVAIVQGNVPRLGFDFNAQRREVLNNHVEATLDLAARVSAGASPRPDLIVWPENSSDVDPLRDAAARRRIDQAARAIGVPILVGGLLAGPGERVRNVGIVWQPGTGPNAKYVKRHPVPFAEYIPIRPIAGAITDKVDLVRSDFVAGATPGVLQVGPATVGVVICFEVAYDDIVRDTVTGGARLLVVQTNNATFNAAEARQQLAMVRLRAVEHGRSALMASTVGVSGFVTPTGAVLDATGFNTAAVIVRDLRLPAGRSLATRLGPLPELGLVAVAVAVLVAAVVLRRRVVV